MKATDPKMIFRVPAELKDLIQKSADINRRSMNAELVNALEVLFSGKGLGLHEIPSDVLLAEVARRMKGCRSA